MQIIYKTSNTELLMKLTLTEHKVLYSMLNVAYHNLIDMSRVENKIINDTSFTSKTISNAITLLVKNGILRKTKLTKLYFIEPTIFMVGYYKKIKLFNDMVNEGSKDILYLVEEYKQDELSVIEELSLDAHFEHKRTSQTSLSNQVLELDRIEDNLPII